MTRNIDNQMMILMRHY